MAWPRLASLRGTRAASEHSGSPGREQQPLLGASSAASPGRGASVPGPPQLLGAGGVRPTCCAPAPPPHSRGWARAQWGRSRATRRPARPLSRWEGGGGGAGPAGEAPARPPPASPQARVPERPERGPARSPTRVRNPARGPAAAAGSAGSVCRVAAGGGRRRRGWGRAERPERPCGARRVRCAAAGSRSPPCAAEAGPALARWPLAALPALPRPAREHREFPRRRARLQGERGGLRAAGPTLGEAAERPARVGRDTLHKPAPELSHPQTKNGGPGRRPALPRTPGHLPGSNRSHPPRPCPGAQPLGDTKSTRGDPSLGSGCLFSALLPANPRFQVAGSGVWNHYV